MKLKVRARLKGGPGSGHYGHAGRPGKVGGSAPGKLYIGDYVLYDNYEQARADYLDWAKNEAPDHIRRHVLGGAAVGDKLIPSFSIYVLPDDKYIIIGYEHGRMLSMNKKHPDFANVFNQDPADQHAEFGAALKAGALQIKVFDKHTVHITSYNVPDTKFLRRIKKLIDNDLLPTGNINYVMYKSGQYLGHVEGTASELLQAKYITDGQLKEITEEKGGPGSGHFGHRGRPGKVGGSAPGKGGVWIKSDGVPNNSDFISALGGRPDEDDRYYYHVTTLDNLSGIADKGLVPGIETNFPGYITNEVALDEHATVDDRGPEFVGGAGYYGVIVMTQDYDRHKTFRKPVMLRVNKSNINAEPYEWHVGEYRIDHISSELLEYWDNGSWVPLSVIEEKQLPIDDAARRKLFQIRLDVFYDSSDALAEQVFTGQLSISDWELSMRTLVKEMHTSAAAIGKGGWDQMTFQEWGRLGTPVREQYKYLNKFAQDIADRIDDISLGTIRARARMYGRAAGYVAELMQAPKEIIDQLPWLPKDGSTECLTNCKCAWLLKVIKKTKVSQTVRAVWRMLEAEHCRDCPERNGYIEIFDVDAMTQVPSIIGGF